MFNTLPKLDQYHGLRLTGPDAVDFAQRLFSRDLRKISEGEGKLCLFLDAEARVIGIFWLVRRGAQDLELYIPDFHWERMQEKLELFQFTERFEKEIISLEVAFSPDLPKDLSALKNYEGIIQNDVFFGVWNSLTFRFSKNEERGNLASKEDWEWHRINAGIPKEPEDFDADTLCLKLGWEELCDESKGCYAGQEIIERVRTRGGQSPEKLFVLQSNEKPRQGENISFGDSLAGRLTQSIAKNPDVSSPKYVALAYIKKKLQNESQFLSASGREISKKA